MICLTREENNNLIECFGHNVNTEINGNVDEDYWTKNISENLIGPIVPNTLRLSHSRYIYGIRSSDDDAVFRYGKKYKDDTFQLYQKLSPAKSIINKFHK